MMGLRGDTVLGALGAHGAPGSDTVLGALGAHGAPGSLCIPNVDI